MRNSEQNHPRHDPESGGKGVVFFLTLPVVFVVLLLLSLGCEDPGRTGTADEEASAAESASSTVTSDPASDPSTTARTPERPRPPLDSASGGPEPETDSASEPVAYETAETAYLEGRYDEAVGLFQSYGERRPGNPWAHYMLGLSAWKTGDLELAEKELRETVRRTPEHRKGWVNLARVLLDDERAGEAREAVTRALEIEPERSDALRVLGLAAQEAGETSEAVDAYRRAILANPEDAWSMNNLALIRIRRGDFEAAIPPLARAVELRDDVPVFHNNLGVALERTGRFATAAEAYRKADELPGGHQKAGTSLARVEELDQPPELEPVELAALAEEFVRTIDTWREERMAADPKDGAAQEPN